MKVIGLCGGSGSGKSTVSQIFLERGIPSVNTDAVYHDLTSRKSPCLDALVSEFGEEILNENGALDRRALSKIVFSGDASSENRRKLNLISHKFVLDATRDILKAFKKDGAKAALVDAPLLFESGFNKECDAIIAVIADEKTRISRIIARDNITENAAKLRINSQLSDAYLQENSDYVIDNSGDISETENAAIKVLNKIIGM